MWDISCDLQSPCRVLGDAQTRHSNRISAIHWSNGPDDASCLYSASHDGTVRIWDVINGSLIHSFVAFPIEEREEEKEDTVGAFIDGIEHGISNGITTVGGIIDGIHSGIGGGIGSIGIIGSVDSGGKSKSSSSSSSSGGGSGSGSGSSGSSGSSSGSGGSSSGSGGSGGGGGGGGGVESVRGRSKKGRKSTRYVQEGIASMAVVTVIRPRLDAPPSAVPDSPFSSTHYPSTHTASDGIGYGSSHGSTTSTHSNHSSNELVSSHAIDRGMVDRASSSGNSIGGGIGLGHRYSRCIVVVSWTGRIRIFEDF